MEQRDIDDVAADTIREAPPQPKRALITDDDRFFRTLLGDLLRGAGYDVLEAKSADEAFSHLLDAVLHLDVLVLDLHMPGLSGAELIERIRKLGGETELAVVMLTGATLSEIDKERLAQLGADDIIAKTTPPDHLVRRIEQTIAFKARPT